MSPAAARDAPPGLRPKLEVFPSGLESFGQRFVRYHRDRCTLFVATRVYGSETKMRACERTFILGIVCAAAILLAGPVLAHTGGGLLTGGFSSGFSHPISGWDHVVAMVAVGLWGAILGLPAIWLLPIVFPVVMAFGGVLGVTGVMIPEVETGIAFSAIILGLAVAFAARPPLWLAAVIVAVFAVFHGHAHGTELPTAANPFAYAVGFVIATGLLHILGIMFGLLARWPAGRIAVQAGGGAIVLVGLAFLIGIT
jgi:urease accessory protein